jgi:integrase
VTIPAFLAEELAAHMAEYMRPPAEDPSGADLLFTSREGNPIRRTNFRRRYWKPAIRAAGLEPAPVFHHLRHKAAAPAIASGAHPKAIQARLGHASITTTLDRYGHLFPSLDEELADRLDAARSKARDSAASLLPPGGSEVIPIEAARAE